MASGGQQPVKGKSKWGMTDKGASKRGCRCPDLGPYILGGGAVSIVIWVGDMGDDSMHQESSERNTPQNILKADG